MNIQVISIAKKEHDMYDPLIQEFRKMIGRFASIEDTVLFPKAIQQAHNEGVVASQLAYAKTLEPYKTKSYSVVLHPDAKIIDSFEFSKLLSDKMALNFFIGGAYGFDETFVRGCDKAISLSKLTMSHKVAKVVLFEQIYRGFSILSNHPYHK
ncbi:MAG: 50S rRNA methyltransferase [Sulfuricurvum sp. PC08-66]|nr:MAG: 50S rRNA methyltransferase [Sulfuricurvum sp. PC08-66]